MGRILMLAVFLMTFTVLNGCGGSSDPVPEANPAKAPDTESISESGQTQKKAIGKDR